MGILNISGDSFYAGSRCPSIRQAVERARQMALQGADIIDVGGQSTRPGSCDISHSDEIKKVVPIIKALAGELDITLSCDTYKARVAEKALEAGASIINDISAFAMDKELLSIIKSSDCGYVLMHMQGTPADMQKNPYYMDTVAEIHAFLGDKLAWMDEEGINPARVAIDPGIGFGKRTGDNLLLLKNLEKLTTLGRPVLVGASRKSFIGHLLGNLPPEERLEGSIATAVTAYASGGSIFRVHDVQETRRALAVTAEIKNS